MLWMSKEKMHQMNFEVNLCASLPPIADKGHPHTHTHAQVNSRLMEHRIEKHAMTNAMDENLIAAGSSNDAEAIDIRFSSGISDRRKDLIRQVASPPTDETKMKTTFD